jgi:hypothetical protein
VDLGVNIDALGLSTDVLETAASLLGLALFVGMPLTRGEIVVSITTVSRGGGAFDSEDASGFVMLNV